ncbi:MAG: MFS transporter [Actinobacteria bacterium]|nr:MFS transporter [Actinomycetota bacterium]
MNINKIRENVKVLFRPAVISWALYDLANTSFAVIIITIVFPLYFTGIIVKPGLYPENFGDLMWGIAGGVSMIITSVLAPLFGAVADTSRSKNKFLMVLTLACIVFTVPLFFLKSGMVAPAVILFIVANVFYQTSMMFYNSFLPQLSTRKNTGLVSGFGFSIGYMGGFLILVILIPLLKGGLEPGNLFNIRLSLLITSLFFLVFSIPSFIFLKDLPSTDPIKRKASYLVHGFKKLATTLKNIRKYPDLTRFLISYFLFSNAFSILALYVAIYAKNTLNFSLYEIVILFMVGQIPTVISSIFFGWLTDRIGAKKTISITLIMWVFIIILVSSYDIKAVFYTGWILASITTGSTLIASRSLMARLIPVAREAEFFGFYSISGKVSSILGPVTFGVVSFITKSQRLALLTTMIFLISGFIVLQFVGKGKKKY